MSLDSVSLPMIRPLVSGAAVLCLGYPEMPNGQTHLNTVNTLMEWGATAVDVVDVIQHRGMERVVDLNEPQAWPRRYGLVVNPGTVEHCFNVGRAWANAWSAVEVGGHVMHVAPATMLNHGFWNLCPVAVEDWCEANGGAVVEMQFAINKTQRTVKPEGVPGAATGRGALPAEAVMYALCRKLRDVPLKWPAQGVYRR